jgi:hypothetical protein
MDLCCTTSTNKFQVLEVVSILEERAETLTDNHARTNEESDGHERRRLQARRSNGSRRPANGGFFHSKRPLLTLAAKQDCRANPRTTTFLM